MIDFAEKHVEFILEFRPVLFPLDGFNDSTFLKTSLLIQLYVMVGSLPVFIWLSFS
jgi:hypothetical protein